MDRLEGVRTLEKDVLAAMLSDIQSELSNINSEVNNIWSYASDITATNNKLDKIIELLEVLAKK
jgi:hypothetical protein